MPKAITSKHIRPTSKSKVNMPESSEQATAKTISNHIPSTKKSTDIFLTLPREVLHQILFQTFVEHIEYEIRWYGRYIKWKRRVRNTYRDKPIIEPTTEIKTWANDLRLAYPELIDDVDYVEGQAAEPVRKAETRMRLYPFRY
ncbi:hypothetical protein Vi05172_g10420 [Venturia inaequalis]|uniref:Uncharacterized protein n=2 Tax=Venturia inaequalis TaxID=5025 RepID=A0A8H3URJ1_VENIN|nr:hypothetical protein EG327_008317 [Venturia inaequalis]RDI79555.1 hypothetical protein Vi05172_g10420 [Venturia inaequalis]